MTLQSGELFANRFEIDCVAGSGGMGTVYRARDRSSGQLVALKLLHGDRTDGNDSARFIREAWLLSELRHPGIVAHVTHGQTPQGERFLAMQWLEGEDLAARLTRGPLSVSDALLLARRVAEALGFAHRHGILHRDLKPTNLFLPDGDVGSTQILDFGIARRLGASRRLTRTGLIVGTPEYMAPEQARCAQALTPAADIFSLGCVLYECLTGEPPFIAENIAAVLVRILFEEPVAVSLRRLGIPDSVQALLDRMLVKDPAQRIGQAQDVAAAVAAIGAVSDLPLSPTLPATVQKADHLSDSEQVLLSLVLAMPPKKNATERSTVLATDAVAELGRHDSLLVELRQLGAQADLLLSGALVVTVPQMASAKDQAALAARCAATIKNGWPEAHMAVVTGRGSRTRGLLTGEALDRAWH